MNILDYIIIGVLAVGVIRGFSTGAIRQVVSLLGLVIAFIFSVQLMRPIGSLVVDSLGVSERVAPVVGFIVVFLIVQVAIFAVIRLAEGVLGALRITVLNRIMGGAVGGLIAAVALSVIFLVLGSFGVPGRETETGSSLYGPVSGVLPEAWGFVSEQLPQVEALSEKFGERVEEHLPPRP